MPIYEYRCSSCGVQKDILQKISEAPLTICTECGQPTFSKQITAAGFQLKGSGWYVTDFKNPGFKNSGQSSGNNPDSKPEAKPEPVSSVAALPATPPASESA